jgi:hypothetical protein
MKKLLFLTLTVLLSTNNYAFSKGIYECNIGRITITFILKSNGRAKSIVKDKKQKEHTLKRGYWLDDDDAAVIFEEDIFLEQKENKYMLNEIFPCKKILKNHVAKKYEKTSNKNKSNKINLSKNLGKYQHILTKKTYAENGNGVWLSNKTKTIKVSYGSTYTINKFDKNNQMILYKNIKKMYQDNIKAKNESNEWNITYKRQKDNWYVLSGFTDNGNIIFYEKEYLINGVRSGFNITFPTKEKENYDDLIKIISKNFIPTNNKDDL